MGIMLRGIDFGSAFTASGTLNFFGEGWRPFHQLRKMRYPLGYNFSGATFVAKSMTLESNGGNMPLNKKLQPKELFPRCIKIDFRKKIVLNAVKLSNPGSSYLLAAYEWQRRSEPFFISFAPIGKTSENRLQETRIMASKLMEYLPGFNAPVGLQIDMSCPSIDYDQMELSGEAVEHLKIFEILGIPLDIKINALVLPETVREIERSGLLHSLSVSNSIPWGALPGHIDWKGLFGSPVSPLAEFGGGGLSGAPLLPIVGGWVEKARQAGIIIPIIAGGGILHPEDVNYLRSCGTSAIALGTVAILCPWNVRKIIQKANSIF